MLEILLLIYLSKKIGKIAASRGHRKGPNIRFFILLWIAGEFIGALLGMLIFKGRLIPVYIFAIAGAAIATVISFNVVQNLEDISDDDDVMTIEID